MRVEIKTGGRIQDRDVRALYLIHEAMKISSARMRTTNLDFVYGKVLCGDYERDLSPRAKKSNVLVRKQKC